MTYILLQARLSSTRLPAKVMLTLKNQPIFELSAKRLGTTGLPVVLCTSTEKSDDLLAEYALARDIEVYRGNLEDVLYRFASFAENLPDDTIIVRATADNVFPDGNFVQILVDEFKKRNLGYLYANSSESDLPDGLKIEVFRAKELSEATKNTTSSFDREHVTPYIIRKYGASYSKQWCGEGYGKLRATIDTLSDYLKIANVFQRVEDPLKADSLYLCRILKELTSAEK